KPPRITLETQSAHRGSAALQTFLLEGWDVPSDGGGITHVHMEPGAVEVMAELEPEDRTLTRIAAEMGFAKGSDAGVTAQRLDSSRGIIRPGKPYSFRHRAVEAYLPSDWPDVS